MKRALILMFLATATPAAAQLPYQQHEAEARRLLAPCPASDRAETQACQHLQMTFVKLYVVAFTGDFYAIVAIAAKLQADHTTPGLAPNQVEACAWWTLLSLTTGHNPDYDAQAARQCGDLAESDRTAAEARLRAIAASINPDAAPPPGWTPKIASAPPPPSVKSVKRECLDSTVCPLGQDCPKFVPPPGCPKF